MASEEVLRDFRVAFSSPTSSPANTFAYGSNSKYCSILEQKIMMGSSLTLAVASSTTLAGISGTYPKTSSCNSFSSNLRGHFMKAEPCMIEAILSMPASPL